MMRIETVSLPSSGYGSKPVTLTVYAQDNVAAHEGRRRPAVIVCPGGGYGFCSDREAEPMALAFVARGLQAFVLDYTVLDEGETSPLLPHPQRDLARAVALVRENAEGWHVDADQIAILGCSAGGHLCATYTGLAQDPAFAAELGLAPEQIAVNAQILCYPVIDLTAGWPSNPELIPAICGEELVHAQELVSPATPRTFVWHTAADDGVPVRNTYAYAAALAEAGVDHDCHVFHRGRHGLSLGTKQSAKNATYENAHVAHWLDLAIEWLEEGFAGPGSDNMVAQV